MSLGNFTTAFFVGGFLLMQTSALPLSYNIINFTLTKFVKVFYVTSF